MRPKNGSTFRTILEALDVGTARGVVMRWAYPEEVRHASRNADSVCPFLYWRDGKKGHAESAFRDACRTSSGAYLLGT